MEWEGRKGKQSPDGIVSEFPVHQVEDSYDTVPPPVRKIVFCTCLQKLGQGRWGCPFRGRASCWWEVRLREKICSPGHLPLLRGAMRVSFFRRWQGGQKRWWWQWKWWWLWGILQHLLLTFYWNSDKTYQILSRATVSLSTEVRSLSLGHPAIARATENSDDGGKKKWIALICSCTASLSRIAVWVPWWRRGECLQISASFVVI